MGHTPSGRELDGTPPAGLIAVGRLTRPHGLRGELVFLPYVHDLALLPDLVHQRVFLQQGRAPAQPTTILEWRALPKRVLVRLTGCQDVTAAEALRDSEIYIPRGWFPPLPEGEYYWFEIEGLAVYASDGRYLGNVVEIIYTGSNDVYVVRHNAQEVLIPALKNVVRTIDLEGRAMHLHAVAGLLE